MSWRRLALVGGAGLAATAAGAVLAIALTVATGGTARWFPSMNQFPLWWAAGSAVAAAGSGVLAWRTQAWYDRGQRKLAPAVRRPDAWVVARPAEVDQVVAAFQGGRRTVGITTALQGAGGFGKTTVAAMVCGDQRVLREFGGRVYWVTVGGGVGGDALAARVTGLVARIDQDRAVPSLDVRQAAEHLAAVLADGPRRLLILDDVWTEEQVAAFPVAGRCARLITTRNSSLVSGDAAIVSVRVDQMSVGQAMELLTAGLPGPLPSRLANGLLEQAGYWPLLLRLINKILIDQARLQADVSAAAEDLLRDLRRSGVLRVDELTGAARQLDVNDPGERAKAIRASILASTGRLDKADRDRLAEMAVFAEDETIPVSLVAALWGATAGLDALDTRALCARLADLALLDLARGDDGGAVSMHDVVRDYLRSELGAARLRQLHGLLVDAAAASLPDTRAGAGAGIVPAWWELPGKDRYLRDHLIEHMAAGGHRDAETIACDLRWVVARLDQAGPAAPYADLARLRTPRAERLRRLLGQAAHLLAPTDPRYSLADILCSRVSRDPDWGPQSRALLASRTTPYLSSAWPMPDLPGPGLRRILAGHDDGRVNHSGRVNDVAIAADGTWLASASNDLTVRIWDVATGKQRAVLSGHNLQASAVAIAPDGTWLATGDHGTVRIWDATSGTQRVALTGHHGSVKALAIAPDGTWLASACLFDGTVRIWDATSGAQRAVLSGHGSQAHGVAIAPDGTWLATCGSDGKARIWDAATSRQRAALSNSAHAVAIAPDGTWLVTGGSDGKARIWDAATSRQRAALSGHSGPVTAAAIAPDGTWLATARSNDLSATASGDDKTVWIWDAATGRQRAALTGHLGSVTAVAIAPDGTWLATGDAQGAVRIWDATTGEQQADRSGHGDLVTAVAIAPDGTWLATGGRDKTVRTWDAATGRQRAVLTGHRMWVNTVAIAPDGTWLASGDADKTVRIWDATTGEQRAVLIHHDHGHHLGFVTAVAIAPDGAWFATSGNDGAVRIWDATTGRERAILSTPRILSQWIGAVAIAPDGTWLATVCQDGTVRIWDATTGEQRAVLSGHTRHATALAIAPDGAWFATGGDEGTVGIWDTTTGKQRAVLSGHDGRVTGMAVAPDGSWLATVGTDGSLLTWDTATHARHTLMRVDGRLADCQWSPDGTSIAATGERGLYYFTFKGGSSGGCSAGCQPR